MNLTGTIQDFFSLIYPRTCNACGESLITGEECICTLCRFHLPKTRMHLEEDNKFTEIFLGRIPIETGTALFYFQKGGKVQELIHRFKYKGRKEIGHFLGGMLGEELRSSSFYEGIDLIIPVPLHPDKMRKRGFNQSEVIAGGIAQSMGIPHSSKALIRSVATQTQTRKTRFRRWENVESVFETPNPQWLENKNLLLVDDVVTTGSTLEACAQKLLAVEGTRVWLVTLAITY